MFTLVCVCVCQVIASVLLLTREISDNKTLTIKSSYQPEYQQSGNSQVAERLGNWTSNQKVAGLIPGRANDTSPYLPPVLTVSRSG